MEHSSESRKLRLECVLTSSVSMILQHWPTDVMRWFGLIITVSAGDGTAQDSQYPLHALVVIRNSTQLGMLIFLVWPENGVGQYYYYSSSAKT